MTSVHTEKTLESAIVAALTSEQVSERSATYLGESRTKSGGYVLRNRADYDRALCLDLALVARFLEATQPKEWARLGQVHGDKRTEKFLSRLSDEIGRRGTLDVLRGVVKDHGCSFKMAYFAPASGLNPDHAALYDANILSVMRQVPFSERTGQTLDIVLFVNGIPVSTAELKHHLSGQNVKHAMHQYQTTRDPREPLLKRCVVHFAVDDDLVYVTAQLAGKDTRFLPFNRGHGDGAGNPPNPAGFRTAYLWEEVWARESWLDLLDKFCHVGVVNGDEQRTIFPRYHQMDAVRRLVADARRRGAGGKYLIQHSAGSGKSNTIAWLVHRLAQIHDDADKRVFDSVIVVTDRRVLDRQLRTTITDFERVAGVVTGITQGSQELKSALESGRPIIVTTVQKFPFIANEIVGLPGKRFAIVIDEAHSGQSGETQRAMSKALTAKTLEEAEAADSAAERDEDDEILRELERTGMAKNASYFAFTATPKARTLEMFGTEDADGKFHAFSLYTMRQAIEEKFILDVLQNYTTYHTYFSLLKKVEDDPNYDRKAATAVMLRFVDLHQHGIRRKAELMVEHFLRYSAHRLGGQAKAMVVTRSRLHAVRYKQAFDAILAERNAGFKALVAFSGTVKDGVDYTESGMNGFAESMTAGEFAKPGCRFLVVAEKFQTGFDQPLLHTMYVDKKLTGLNAVQTLSRLNRTHPDKEETFVLDFANEAEEIQKAFEPYYRATILSEATDPNKLYDLERQIMEFRFFYPDDVNAFVSVVRDAKKRPEKKLAEMHALLDQAVELYSEASEDERSQFKRLVEQFARLYAFLSQIIAFADVDLEKLYQYCRWLRTKLPLTRRSLPSELLEQINMDSYRLANTGTHALPLVGGVEVKPGQDIGTGGPWEPEEEPLSQIIKQINEVFGTDFDEGDRVMIAEVERRVLADSTLRDAVQANRKEAVRLVYDKLFEKALSGVVDDNWDFYKKVMDNAELHADLREELFKVVYRKLLRPDSD